MAQFAVVTMESIWMERNRIWIGNTQNWLELSSTVNRMHDWY